jgi:hypothetical protein
MDKGDIYFVIGTILAIVGLLGLDWKLVRGRIPKVQLTWRNGLLVCALVGSLIFSAIGWHKKLTVRVQIVERPVEKVVERLIPQDCSKLPEANRGSPHKQSQTDKASAKPGSRAPLPSIEQHGDATGAIGGNVTQGPCSNLQVGGKGNRQATNCTFDTQPRTISFKTIGPSVSSSVSVKVWVDRDFPNAKFVVICDHPCKAIEGHIDWEGHPPSTMMGPEVETGTVPNIPDTEKLAVFVVDHPEVFGPDISLLGVVKSSDDAPIRLIGVKSLTITTPR